MTVVVDGTTGIDTIQDRIVTPAKQSQPLTLGTAQNTTSGTSIDFTSIPSWVKRITVMLNGVSTNGTSFPQFQLGDSGGVEVSGYFCAATSVAAAAVATANATTGFILNRGDVASVIHGSIVFTLVDFASNTWTASGNFGLSNSTFLLITSGSKSTSSILDRIRLTTVNGTDTFDAGSVNILYEG